MHYPGTGNRCNNRGLSIAQGMLLIIGFGPNRLIFNDALQVPGRTFPRPFNCAVCWVEVNAAWRVMRYG